MADELNEVARFDLQLIGLHHNTQAAIDGLNAALDALFEFAESDPDPDRALAMCTRVELIVNEVLRQVGIADGPE